MYEVKVDTDGDAVADLAYSVQFVSSEDGKQAATVRRLQGVRAAGVGEEGEVIVQHAPVSVGREALVDLKLEVVVVPVSDVDRAKSFYTNVGWRLDADFNAGKDFRVIQVTPPGSPCSVIFGTGITSVVSGSAQGLHLVVSDIETARADLVDRGVGMSEVFHDAGGIFHPNDVAALAVHVMTNTALTGATYDIDGGQQLVAGG